MSSPTGQAQVSDLRFRLNIDRINGMVKFLYDENNWKPATQAFHQPVEGVQADIFRSVVVFLHATFEDLIRSHAPKAKRWTFSSRSDLEKAFKRSKINCAPFKQLYAPLTQMAQRRNRIVHDADLVSRAATICEPWTFVDVWQLGLWLMAVVAFDRQLLEDRLGYDRVRKATSLHHDVAEQMLAFPKISPELSAQALQRMADTWKLAAAELRLSTEVTDDSVRRLT